MRKLFLIFISGCISIIGLSTFAQVDFEPPTVKSLQILGTPKVGGELVVLMEVTDNLSGVALNLDSPGLPGFEGSILPTKGPALGITKLKNVKQVSEARFVLTFSINENMSPGEHYLIGFKVADNAKNVLSSFGNNINWMYDLGTNALPVLKFIIYPSDDVLDFDAPVISSLKIAGDAKPGKDLTIVFEVTDNLSGVLPKMVGGSPFMMGFSGSITSVEKPAEYSNYSVAYKVDQLSDTLFALTFSLNKNMSPGEYYLKDFQVTDKVNNLLKAFAKPDSRYYESGPKKLEVLRFNIQPDLIK